MNDRGLPSSTGGITASQRGLNSKVLQPRVRLTEVGAIATVYFGEGDFLLNSANFEALRSLREALSLHPGSTVRIDGHASTEGAAAENEALSQKRRLTAQLALGGGSPIAADGQAYGESRPAVAEAGRSKQELEGQRHFNRRVELQISFPPTTEKPPADVAYPAAQPRPQTAEERLDAEFRNPTPPRPETSSVEGMVRDALERAWDESGGPLLKKLGVPDDLQRRLKRNAVGLAMDQAFGLLEDELARHGVNVEDRKNIIKALRAELKKPRK